MVDNEQIAFAVITIISSFVIGYCLSLANDWRRARDAKRKSIESLVGELNDVITFVKNKKDPIVKINGTGVQLHGASFQRASFDSILYSQTFREFDVKTQVKIATFYEKIKVTNLLGTKLLEIITLGDPTQTKFVENLKGWGKNVEDRLKDHQEEATKLVAHLEDLK